MNIIIVGCGDVGAELAKTLSVEDHNVTVVDKNSAAFRRLGSGFNGATVHGPGIDIDILKSAGVEMADALAAVTSEDNVNIMVAQVARQLFGVRRVVARIYDISREHVYREFGLETVCPTILGVDQLRQSISGGDYAQARSFGSGELLEVDVAVPENLSGQAVSDLEIPDKLRIVVLSRSGRAIMPSAATQLQTGDTLSCMVRLDTLRTLLQLFGLEGKR